MPTPRLLSEYPGEYSQLFLRAARERVRIDCADGNEARRLRARLYTYRSAIYDSPFELPKVTLLAPLVRLRIDGRALVLEPIEPLNNKLQEAVNNAA